MRSLWRLRRLDSSILVGFYSRTSHKRTLRLAPWAAPTLALALVQEKCTATLSADYRSREPIL